MLRINIWMPLKTLARVSIQVSCLVSMVSDNERKVWDRLQTNFKQMGKIYDDNIHGNFLRVTERTGKMNVSLS